jgi:hypothetical protein
MSDGARQFQRVNATIPVRLDDGGDGVTRDLAPGGVFFVTEADLRPGSPIHFTLEFEHPTTKLMLDCVGEVVRVEKTNGKTGVAVKITRSQLERRDDALTQMMQAAEGK